MAFLEINNVSKTFGQGTPHELTVLQDVTFGIERSEVVGIIGPSGAGKSTLLQILGALDRPTKGAIKFDGIEPFSMTAEKLAAFRNKKVGFVFQFHHLLPEFTALENVMMPLMIGGKTKRESSNAAREILTQLGLADRLDHRPSELSGGEQQRVAIARAAVHRPDLLLADEPTGNLDLKTGAMVFDILLELNKSMKVTLVVVTHSPSLADKMQRVLIIEDGKLKNGRKTVV